MAQGVDRARRVPHGGDNAIGQGVHVGAQPVRPTGMGHRRCAQQLHPSCPSGGDRLTDRHLRGRGGRRVGAHHGADGRWRRLRVRPQRRVSTGDPQECLFDQRTRTPLPRAAYQIDQDHRAAAHARKHAGGRRGHIRYPHGIERTVHVGGFKHGMYPRKHRGEASEGGRRGPRFCVRQHCVYFKVI